jgi:putative component of membrane protein insertase Oxa1/YidC/SpoIIIJ protein YidD
MKKIFLLFCVSVSSVSASVAQTVSDNTLLKEASFEKKEYKERVVVYGFSENKKKTINPLYHILSLPMYVYQSQISPQLSTRCAYNPSCSAYSKDLIKRYGFIKGIFCSSDRLMRCNRIALADIPAVSIDNQDKKIHEDVERYCVHNKKRHQHTEKQ